MFERVFMEKTLVMKMLDSKKIPYTVKDYSATPYVDAKEVAACLGQDLNKVYKTLVTVGKSKKYYVFVVPADHELDLKKAAKVTNEKNIEMIHQKELLPLTGYIHGGCSPIGMKKLFPTYIDSTAENLSTFFVSGGKVGFQIEINPQDLVKLIRARFADII